MNKIYKVIYSKVKKQYIVVSELAKAHTKGGVRSEKRAVPLAERLFGAALAFGLAVGGFVLPADAAITPISGYEGTVKSHPLLGDTTNVYVQAKLGDTGVNRFKDFTVEQGHTANMYFYKNSGNDTSNVSNLVNMVNSKIEINGVVNALQKQQTGLISTADKIGGHLFFLSVDGMAVGASGAINAGQLTVLTPSRENMNEWMGDNFAKVADAIKEPGKIALNPSGTITVNGQINAPSGIAMYAGSSIDIQKGTLDEDVKNPEKYQPGQLNTGTVKFSTVNTGTFYADNTLSAANDNGDIILSVKSDNATVNIGQDTQINATNNVDIKATAESKTSANAAITVDGSVSGKTVDIVAEATSKVEEGETLTAKIAGKAEKVLGFVGIPVGADFSDQSSTAKVIIGENAEITATGNDTTTTEDGKTITTSALNIAAKSIIKTTLNAENAAKGTSGLGKTSMPALSFAYAGAKNTAEVTIEENAEKKASLTANKGSVAVNAAADTQISVSVTADPDEKSAFFLDKDGNDAKAAAGSFGVAVIKGKTEAKTTVNGAITAQKDVTVNAEATSEIESEMEAAAGDGSIVATGVNVVDYNSAALTEVNGNITSAQGDVNITATNTLEGNTITTDTSMGDSTFDIYKDKVKDHIKDTSKTVEIGQVKFGELKNGLLDFIKSKEQEEAGQGGTEQGDQPGLLEELGKKLNAGAAIQVVLEKNTSEVKIGNGAVITANTGDANIKAETNIEDTQMTVVAETNNQHKDDESVPVAVSAAVLYSDMDNDSKVTVGDGAQITAVQDVKVNAETTMSYNRVEKMIENIDDAVKELETELNTLSDTIKDQDLIDKFNALKTARDTAKAKLDAQKLQTNPAIGFEELQAALKVAKAFAAFAEKFAEVGKVSAGTLIEGAGAVKEIISGALEFVHPDSYANFYVRTQTSSGEESQGKLDIAGSVNVNKTDNDATVLIGKNAVITANNENKAVGTAGNVNIGSDTTGTSVSFTGNASSFLIPSSAKGVGVGASVAVELFGGEAKTLVAEGAQVSGKNIDINAQNKATRTSVVFSGGMADEGGLSGMVNVLSGDSNALALVDDEAKLEAANAINIHANNDTVITNVAGGIMIGSGAASVGAGVAINNYDVNTVAGVIDIDKDADAQKVEAEQKDADKQAVTEGDVLKENAATTEEKKEPTLTDKVNEAKKKIANARKAAFKGMSEADKTAFLGTADTNVGDDKKGITAKNVTVDSAADGTINAIAVAGSVAKSQSQDQTVDGTGAAADKKPGFFDKVKTFANDKMTGLETALDEKFTAIDGKVAEGLKKITGYQPADQGGTQIADTTEPTAPGEGGEQSGGSTTGGETPSTGGTTTPGTDKTGQKEISTHISVAGSVALNLIDGETAALVDNAQIMVKPTTEGNVAVNANDDAFTGAWAGGAAVNWLSASGKSGGGSQTSVGVAGGVGINKMDRDVAAVIKNSQINGAKAISNTAAKGGASVATALGMAVTKLSGQNDTNVAAGVAVSYNGINTDVHALMIDDKVNVGTSAPQTNITNSAYSSDVQVTGGVSTGLSFGGNGMGAGASVVISNINNDVTSAVTNTQKTTAESAADYNNIDTMDVKAGVGTKQITAGVGVAASNQQKGAAVEGVVVYNGLDNNTNAEISKVKIAAGGDVKATAFDSKKTANKYKKYLEDRKIDADGSGYMNVAEGDALIVTPDETTADQTTADQTPAAQNPADQTSAAQPPLTEEQKEEKLKAEKINTNTGNEAAEKDVDFKSKLKDANDKNKNENDPSDNSTEGGNVIVSAALSVAASSGKGSVGAAVVVEDINNKRTSTIDQADITAANVKGEAETDSILVSAAMGIGGSKKFGGAGSFSWQGLNNSAIAKVENSTIKTDALDVNAKNDTIGVNVAGQVSAGSVAVGLAGAVHHLTNTTGAYVTSTNIDKLTAGNGVKVALDAHSKSKIFSVGAGVSATTENLAVNGTVAVNTGTNSTEAVIDGATIQNVAATNKATTDKPEGVIVTAEDETLTVAAVGGVAAGSGSAVGGAIAVNDIGALSNKQKVTSQIKESTITSTNAENTTVKTAAQDSAHMITVALGVGASGKAAVQGSAATSLLNKDVKSGLVDTNINNTDNNKDKVNVIVDAKNEALIVDTAVVVAASQKAAIGAGVAVNKITQKTKAGISGGTINAKNVAVQAEGTPNLYTIGVGAAGAKDVAVAGNVAVNIIKNDSKALVKGAAITAENNISVLAKNDEKLHNYAFTGALAAGGEFAGGASVSYNEINSETLARAKGSTLNAKGKDKAAQVTLVERGVSNQEENDENISKITSKETKREKFTKDETKKTGVVVAAESERHLDNVSVAASIAASSSVGVGAAANVAVNNIGGSTKAKVVGTAINNVTGNTASDVTVKATDFTDSMSVVGAGAVGVGADGGGAVAGSADTLLVTREVKAVLNGGSDGKIVNAKNLTVDAKQYADMVTSANGVAVSGGTYGGVSGTANVGVAKLQSKTKAIVNNITGSNEAMLVNADHKHKTIQVTNSVAASGALVGVAGGASIGIVKDDAETVAQVSNSTINESNDKAGKVTITAQNATEVMPIAIAVSASTGASGAATVSVNKLESTTSAIVDNSTIKASEFTLHGENKVKANFDMGAASVGAANGVVGVNVNTINTGVNTQVNNSQITANTADVKAIETLDVDQVTVGAAIGGMSLVSNTLVTSIGAAAAETYTYGDGETLTIGGDADKEDSLFAKVNKAEEASAVDDKSLAGKAIARGKGTTTTTPENNTGAQPKKGTQVTVSNSAITTKTDAGTTTIGAERTNDVNINTIAASVSSESANITVGVLNVDNKLGVTLDGATITAKDIDVTSSVSGPATIHSYQGAAGLASLNAAVAIAKTSGDNNVVVKDSTLTTSGDVDIKAEDKTKTTVEAIGASVGGITGGVIFAQSSNNSTTKVDLSGTNKIEADNSADTVTVNRPWNTVTIDSSKENIVTTKAIGGAVGLASGVGIWAKAQDAGEATVNISGGQNTISADEIVVGTNNAPKVEVYAGSIAAGIGALQLTKAEAAISGQSNLNITGKNNIDAYDVSLIAAAGNESKKATAQATVLGSALGTSFGVSANRAEANTEMQVRVNVDEQAYAGGYDVLTIGGQTAIERKAKISALTVGGYFASGTGEAETAGKDSIAVEAKGGTVSELNVIAQGDNDVTADADGNGGGLVDASPLAAVAKNTLNNTVTATLSGTWNTDTINLYASQTDTSAVKGDATHVGAAAVTGVHGIAEVKGITTAKIADNAKITSNSIDVDAHNLLDLDNDVDGLVVAAAAANITKSQQNVEKTAKVEIGSAVINTTGAQIYEAGTEGTLQNKVNGTAAGAFGAQAVVADNTTKLTNEVTSKGQLLNKGSFDEGGVTLAAYDDIEQNSTASADIPVALAGALVGEVDSTNTRINTIDVTKGKIVSERDINLYAGADSDGDASQLTQKLNAAAYNHAAIPIVTKPSVNLKVNEKSTVNVAQNVTGDATRHINIIANGGRTSIMKAANLYSWVKGGGSETRDYVGNAEGEAEFKGQDKDNSITVDGTLTAGTKNNVEITIRGQRPANDDYVIVGNPTTHTVTGTPEYTAGVTYGTMDYSSQLAERWQELTDLMNEYYAKVTPSEDPNKKVEESNLTAYLAYKQEKEQIESELKKLGLFDETDKAPITGGLEIGYVALPDIVASGGNINLTTDDVKGSGTLKAQGTPKVEITNTSSDYLVVNDVVIGEPGGEVHYNNTAVTSGAEIVKNNSKAKNITGPTVKATSDKNQVPSISIVNNYTGGDFDIQLSEKAKAKYQEEAENLYSAKKTQVLEATVDNEEERLELLASLDKEKTENIESLSKPQNYHPYSHVEIDGLVSNPWGQITIDNKSNSGSVKIVTSEQRASGVNGQKVTIKATGDIVQGATDGIVNIGGNPEYQYASAGQTLQDEINNKNKTADVWHEQVNKTLEDLQKIADVEQKMLSDLAKADIAKISLVKSDSVNSFDSKLKASMRKAALKELQSYLNNARYSAQVAKILLGNSEYVKALQEDTAPASNTKPTTFGRFLNSARGNEITGKTVLALARKKMQNADAANEANGRIAGGNIYLSATDVNVNGLIQSGYDTYSATITDTMVDNAQKRGETVVIDGQTMYKVNNGGTSVFDKKNNKYNYVVQVYYNPKTDKLIVEDVDTQGGHVYLTGNISSTGGGKILAADGGADITIDNQSNKTLQVGKIYNNDIAGSITITDNAKVKDNVKGQQTIYTKGRKQVINLNEYNVYGEAADKSNFGEVTSFTGSATTYQIQPGVRYNWTAGTTTAEKSTYQNDVRKGLWGAVETKNETELADYEKTVKPVEESNSPKKALREGTYIGSAAFGGNTISDETDYVMIADNVVTSNTRSDVEHWTTKSGFLGWFHTHHYRWSVETGSKQTYVHSLKADHDIDIGFIGNENGSITIKGGSDINLSGNIKNHTAASQFVVNNAGGGAAAGGAVIQDGGTSIAGNNITVKAKNGISGLNIMSMGTHANDVVNLDATTKSGDIGVEVIGGIENGSTLAANVNIQAMKTQDGAASLTAAGNIKQDGNGVTVEASRIDLTSRNGKIGTDTQAVVVNAGQLATGDNPLSASLNAKAQGNIHLTQAEGDMRVGTIQSETGDVSLQADGRFVDATPVKASNNNLSIDAKIRAWIEAGQIDSSQLTSEEKITYADAIANYNAKKATAQKAVTDYEKNAMDGYEGVQKLKQDTANEYALATTALANAETNVKKVNANENASAEEKQAAEKALTLAQKRVDDADKANKATAQFFENNLSETATSNERAYAQALDKATSEEEYLAAVKTSDTYKKLVAAREKKAEWTKDQLLYAVKNIVANKSDGSTDEVGKNGKIANVSGNKVTLQGKGIGVDKQSKDVSLSNLQNTNVLKELANADISDVTPIYDYQKNENGEFVLDADGEKIAKTHAVEYQNADGTITKEQEKDILGFTIGGKVPLGVNAKDTLTIISDPGENVYIAGRSGENAGEFSQLKLADISTGSGEKRGDVRILGKAGVVAAGDAQSNKANIQAQNLIVEGGDADEKNLGTTDIGSADKALTVDLTGTLTVHTKDSAYIQNVANNALQMLGSNAGVDMSLYSSGGIVMGSTGNTDLDKETYLKAGKELNIKTDANVGTAGEALRVLANGAVVNVTKYSDNDAVGTVNIEGKKGEQSEADVNLVIGNLQGTDTKITSDGDLSFGNQKVNAIVNVGRLTATAVNNLTQVNGNINAADKAELIATNGNVAQDGEITTANASLTATNGDVALNSGAINATKVTLKAENGAIKQAATHAVTASDTKLSAGKGIDFASGDGDADKATDKHNQIQTVSIKNTNAANDVKVIGGNATGDVTVTFENGSTGKDVTIRNVVAGNTSNLTVKGAVKADGSVVLENAEDAKLTVESAITAKNSVDVKSEGSVEVNGNIKSGAETNVSASDGDATVNGSINSVKKAEVSATGGNAMVSGSVTTTGENADVNVTATKANDKGGNATVLGNIKSGANAKVEATGGNAKVGDKEQNKEGSIEAKGNATVSATGGSAVVNGQVGAGAEATVTATGGDATVNGSINSVKKAEVSATGGNAMVSGNVTTTGENADVNVTATKANDKGGNAIVEGSIDAKGNANVTAIGGDAKVGTEAKPGSITSGANTNVTATNGNVKVTGTITSTDNAVLTANTKGEIEVTGSVQGANVTATTDKGSISMGGTTTATNGDVGLTTKEQGEITTAGKVNATQDITMKAEKKGDIEANGALNAANGKVEVTTVDGQITVGTESATDDTVHAGQSVNVSTDAGDVKVYADVTSDKDATTVETKSGSATVEGSITSGTTADVKATNGNATVEGSINSGANTKVEATGGNATVNGSINSVEKAEVSATGGNATVNGSINSVEKAEVSATGGNAMVSGSITTTGDKANVNVTATKADDKGGNATVEGYIDAKGNANVTANGGNVDVSGTVTSAQDTNLTATDGYVKVGNAVKAGTNVKAKATNGNVELVGKVTATAGNVELTTKTAGNIIAGGEVKAGTDIVATTDAGSVDFKGSADAGHDLNATSKTTGDITFAGTAQAGNNLNAAVNEKGDITFAGTAHAGNDLNAAVNENGDIVFKGTTTADHDLLAESKVQGSINLQSDVTAGNDATVKTHDGSILFADSNTTAQKDIRLTAQNGDVNVETSGVGDIKDNHRMANGDRGFVEAQKGNITISHTGTGDVDLYGIKAQEKAGVSVQNGNAVIHEISGETVAVVVKNPAKKMDVDNVEAKSQILIAGADIDLEQVKQRSDGDGMLAIGVDGAEPDQPIENLNIGDIQTNDTGVRFPHLWLKNGNIKTSKGKFHLDNLYIINKATFSNGQMTTEVFGGVPTYNPDIESSYWIDNNINNPKEYLDEWQNATAETPRWMYLHYEGQEQKQYSDGNLLDLDPYSYVYNQRYSLTNWMRTMQDDEFHHVGQSDMYLLKKENLPQELSLYNRYDVIRDESVKVENASEEEIEI